MQNIQFVPERLLYSGLPSPWSHQMKSMILNSCFNQITIFFYLNIMCIYKEIENIVWIRICLVLAHTYCVLITLGFLIYDIKMYSGHICTCTLGRRRVIIALVMDNTDFFLDNRFLHKNIHVACLKFNCIAWKRRRI